MDELEVPEDLATFLRAGQLGLETECYDTIELVSLAELQVEMLEVTPNLSPFARQDPHRYDGGYYEVPAVNLVAGHPRSNLDFPAWLFLWLPNEQRYGSFDLDHGDVMMFAAVVSWTNIAANPKSFVLASENSGLQSIMVEYLQPWPRYPYIS